HDATAMTNGVHTPTWMGRGAGRILRSRFGYRWARHLLENPDDLKLLDQLPDDELWFLHQARKEALISFVSGRAQRQIARHGGSPDDLRAVDHLISPDVLTLGFARRFATYKRATLMFRDVDRLISIVANESRPVQLLFAGKA